MRSNKSSQGAHAEDHQVCYYVACRLPMLLADEGQFPFFCENLLSLLDIPDEGR